MTTKSIADPDFMHWQVKDLATGEILSNVKYADDEAGLYIKAEKYNGRRIDRFYNGKIKLEDKREKDGLLEALEGARKIAAFFEALVEEREAWRAGG
jgi:hypothetical protein